MGRRLTPAPTTAGPPAPPGREPDPRIERSRRVVLSAALELLGDVGYGGLTIEGVAARAGVGKSTIYRHWPGKLELIEDAVRLLKPDAAPAAGGLVRDRLVALLGQVAAALADSTWSKCLPAIIDAAERDPAVMDIHRRLTCDRREVLVGLLAEGAATGEIPAGTDLCLLAEILVGPIIVRRLLFHEPFDPAMVADLVDQVLPNLR